MMRSFILFFAIVRAISGTDHPIRCLECVAKNSETCEGRSVECPNSKDCLVVSELYLAKNDTHPSIKKGCNPGLPCNSVFYISNFVDKAMRLSTSCCVGNDCNTYNYHMPPEKKEHVGRTCPGCYGHGMVECTSNYTVQCIEEEDKCLQYIGTVSTPVGTTDEHGFKGCASPLACLLKFDGLIGLGEVETKLVECTDQ